MLSMIYIGILPVLEGADYWLDNASRNLSSVAVFALMQTSMFRC